MTRFVTKDVYVTIITQVEAYCASNIFHPSPFYFYNLYCIFIVRNHMHWILEYEYLDFFVWQGLLIAL